MKQIQRRTNKSLKLLSFESYDKKFKDANLPSFITSYRFNLFRVLSTVLIILFYMLGIAFNFSIVNKMSLVLWGIFMIVLEPINPMPAYFLLNILKLNKRRKINSELYNFFNDLKGVFKTSGERLGNLKYFIMDIKNYYNLLNEAIEKMLITWNTEASPEKAWKVFAEELHTEEADRLAIVMAELEKTSVEETGALLEQLREQFANSIYNTYKDYLQKRRFFIYGIAFICTLSIFLCPIVAFYQWYESIMHYMHGSFI